MTIKCGNIVTHTGVIEWGAGMVIKVAPLKTTIQFSDGIIRKIASSHYTILQPADPASFVPIPGSLPVVVAQATPKRKKRQNNRQFEK
jgi:hypothetical protein